MRAEFERDWPPSLLGAALVALMPREVSTPCGVVAGYDGGRSPVERRQGIVGTPTSLPPVEDRTHAHPQRRITNPVASVMEVTSGLARSSPAGVPDLVTLLYEPGQAGQHPPVPELEQGLDSGVVKSAAQTAQGMLIADDQGFLAPGPELQEDPRRAQSLEGSL